MPAKNVMIAPGDEQSPAPCDCDFGQAACATCCGLDALVAPRFFCGQLLTDHDLMTLVDWTRDKLRLGRHRHGWGVVCGLEVTCDPERASGVIVRPGYAVTCCGDDVVVAQDERVDLLQVCRRPDPCADPQDTDQQPSKARKSGKDVDPLQVVAEWRHGLELQAIDLIICYRQEHADSQAALTHDTCGQGAACDFSRTRELFTLVARPVRGTDEPGAKEVKAWKAEYERCLTDVMAFEQVFHDLTAADPEDVRSWLLNQPLQQFCFVRDLVRVLDAQHLQNERLLTLLLFLLIQDRRNSFLTCRCHTCVDDHGVRLARIWLQRLPWSQGGRCRVVAIDRYPPFRRPRGPECWPAPPGDVNVGQVLWHRWEDACTTLADLGISASFTEFAVPDTFAALKSALTCEPFVRCGEPVVAQVLDLSAIGPQLGRRVVGFCGRSGSQDDAPSKETKSQPARRARSSRARSASTKADKAGQ